jgi:acyl CoA:acetate/3-ketoacid CoA transferase beta subunit
MSAYATNELMACELAARLRDDEIVIIGGASPVPMAAALLAQRTTAPDLTVLTGSGAVNPRPSHLAASGGDYAYVAGAEAYFTMEDVFDDTERGRWDVGIFGGIQVDPYGNFNLTFVGGTLAAPRFRGPGLVNAGLPASIARSMLCVERHTPEVFVEPIAFASGAGTRRPDGSPYPASRHGGGPDFCVTGLASLDFTGPGDRMALRTVHAGVDADTVRERTGFALGGPAHPSVTPAPAEETLEVLRRSVDPTGVLRATAVPA